MALESTEYTVTKEEFNEFLGHLTVLNTLSTVQKIKVSQAGTIFYGAISDANESAKLKSVRVFFIKDAAFYQRMPDGLRFTIRDSSEFLKQFSFISKEKDDQITVHLKYNDKNKAVTSIKVSTEALELKAIAGDDDPRLIKDIDYAAMERVMNTAAANWQVEVDEETLDKVKSLCKQDSDSLITLRIKNEEVFLSQHKWRVKLPNKVAASNGEWCFAKQSLLGVKHYKQPVTLAMFQHFVLIDEKQSLYMFSLELQA